MEETATPFEFDDTPQQDRIDFWVQWAAENPQEVGKMLAIKEKQSEHDHLTGLLNRQGFDRYSDAKISELRRKGGTYSFLFGDLNGLKIINDRDGHPAGDEYIKTVARAIEYSIRKEDVCARIGGDEFIVLLPNLSKDQSAEIVSRINELIPAGKGYSISFGVGQWDGKKDLREVLADADSSMYSIKHAGLSFGERSSGVDLVSLD